MTELTTAPTGAPLADGDIMLVRKGGEPGVKQVTAAEAKEYFAEGGGGIEEAPVDGKQYARKDAGWSEVVATGGGGGGATAKNMEPAWVNNYSGEGRVYGVGIEAVGGNGDKTQTLMSHDVNSFYFTAGSGNRNIAYTFPEPIRVTGFVWRGSGNAGTGLWVFEASNDGITWTVLTAPTVQSYGTKREFINPDYYTRYRYRLDSGSAGDGWVNRILMKSAAISENSGGSSDAGTVNPNLPPKANNLIFVSGDATQLTIAEDEQTYLNFGPTVAGDIMRAAIYNIPAASQGNWDFITKLNVTLPVNDFTGGGVVILGTGVTRAVVLGFDNANTFGVSNRTLNSYVAKPLNVLGLSIFQSYWFRVRYDGASLIFYVSSNGKKWRRIGSVTQASSWRRW